MSLQYANKAVKELEEKVYTAVMLWGDDEEIEYLKKQKQETTKSKAANTSKKKDIIERHNGFFAFNSEQFKKAYEELKINSIVQEGGKVVHVGKKEPAK